jgi:hypothetical protein
MIQTVDQYVFLYRTIIEGILTMDTSISLQEYMITKKLYMDAKNQYKVTRNREKEKKEFIFFLNSF